MLFWCFPPPIQFWHVLMVRTIQQIRQDLSALEEAATGLAQELRAVYGEYLGMLGESVRRQLVLVTYQVCTQGYPEQFLKLSTQQRQNFQTDLKGVTRRAQQDLLNLVEAPAEVERLEGDRPPNLDSPADEPCPSDPLESDQDETVEAAIALPSPSEPLPGELQNLPPEPAFSTLEALLSWQEAIEAQVLEVLQTVSQSVNHLLRDLDILPSKLPEQLLDVATKSDLSSELPGNSPNLLNLMVEAKAKDEGEAEVTRVMAVRLRLAEIEFGDVVLTTRRSRLRSLTSRLHQLQRDARKRQRELAIAQAETAWRSTWFEDE